MIRLSWSIIAKPSPRGHWLKRKDTLRAAANEENAAQFEECVANNGKYLAKLVNDHGVQMKAFSDDTWDSFGKAAAEVFEETRDHSALAKEIDTSYQKNLREIGGFMANFETTFLNQRNRVLGLV